MRFFATPHSTSTGDSTRGVAGGPAAAAITTERDALVLLPALSVAVTVTE